VLYLGGFEVEKKRIPVIELGVDNGGSNGGGSFKVELDVAEVTNVQKAGE